MKKWKLTALALLGINMGILLSSGNSNPVESMTPEMRSFYDMLDPEAQKQFLELDTEHRRASMSVINQYCKAVNECKGLREEAVRQQYLDQMQKKG